MKQNNVIAITGGIGSGKSTVSRYLKEKGYFVLSCDEIYKEQLSLGTFDQRFKDEFGDKIFDGGILNTKALADIVFNDEKKLEVLNGITHPTVMKFAFEQCAQQSGVCFVEVPLLFENGFEQLFQQTIVVMRKLDLRIQSVISRSGLSKEEVQARINKQFDYDKADLASYMVIHNDGTMEELKQKVDKLLQEDFFKKI